MKRKASAYLESENSFGQELQQDEGHPCQELSKVHVENPVETWSGRLWSALEAHGLLAAVKARLEAGLWITTDYSGMGGAEVSISETLAHFSKSSGIDVNSVVFARCADVDRVCRQVLLADTQSDGHVQGDMTERLPQKVRRQLASRHAAAKQKAGKAVQGGMAETAAVEKFGAEFLKQATHLLGRLQ